MKSKIYGVHINRSEGSLFRYQIDVHVDLQAQNNGPPGSITGSDRCMGRGAESGAGKDRWEGLVGRTIDGLAL